MSALSPNSTLSTEQAQPRPEGAVERPLEAGEHVVMSGSFKREWWRGALLCLVAFGWLPGLLGFALEGAGVGEVMWPAAAAGVLAALLAPFLFRSNRGRFTLTTRRVLHEPRRAGPVEVSLSEILPGTLRVTGMVGTVELTTPRRVRMDCGAHARELAARIELERWLQTMGNAAPPDAPSRWRSLLKAHVVRSNDTYRVDAYLVLTPHAYALLPITTSDVRYGLAGLLGALPQVSITLEQLTQAFGRLEPSKADAAFDQLAGGFHTTVHRERRCLRRAGFTNTVGFEEGGRVYWFKGGGYEEVMELSSFLAGWEEREHCPSAPG